MIESGSASTDEGGCPEPMPMDGEFCSAGVIGLSCPYALDNYKCTCMLKPPSIAWSCEYTGSDKPDDVVVMPIVEPSPPVVETPAISVIDANIVSSFISQAMTRTFLCIHVFSSLNLLTHFSFCFALAFPIDRLPQNSIAEPLPPPTTVSLQPPPLGANSPKCPGGSNGPKPNDGDECEKNLRCSFYVDEAGNALPRTGYSEYPAGAVNCDCTKEEGFKCRPFPF